MSNRIPKQLYGIQRRQGALKKWVCLDVAADAAAASAAAAAAGDAAAEAGDATDYDAVKLFCLRCCC